MSELKAWQKDVQRYPKTIGDFSFDRMTTALLIVDMQYYDASPDYGIGLWLKKNSPEMANDYTARLKLVVRNCSRLLDFFRRKKLSVFYLAFGALMPDASDMLPLRKMVMDKVPAFSTNSFEYQILDELKPAAGELVVNKTTRCGFIGTCLDHTLRMVGIDTLAIVGAQTSGCVESTARGASDFGYKVILIDDACASFDDMDHNNTMKIFDCNFGKVMDTDEIIEALSKN